MREVLLILAFMVMSGLVIYQIVINIALTLEGDDNNRTRKTVRK